MQTALSNDRSLRKCKFTGPGRSVIEIMRPCITHMQKRMYIHKNPKTQKPGQLTQSTGDAVAPMIGMDLRACLLFCFQEIVANVVDASKPLLQRDFTVRNTDSGIQVVLNSEDAQSEGIFGIHADESEIITWNISTPFAEAGLYKGGDGPKTNSKDSAGGYNYGLKQTVTNLIFYGMSPSMSFSGYDKQNGNAHTSYEWFANKKGISVSFRQNPTRSLSYVANVPIVVTHIKQQSKKPPRIAMKELQLIFANALSTFWIMYNRKKTIENTVQLEDGAALLHRDSFESRVQHFLGHPISLPPGPLILVKGRFYSVNVCSRGSKKWKDGLHNLIIEIPGKGMPSNHEHEDEHEHENPYVAFADEKRIVTDSHATDLLATIVADVLDYEGDPCTSTPDSREKARRALALQLLPLLKGGRSELFGAARGGAIEALIDHYDVDTLKVQDLLLGYVLAPQREELGLSSDEMDTV